MSVVPCALPGSCLVAAWPRALCFCDASSTPSGDTSPNKVVEVRDKVVALIQSHWPAHSRTEILRHLQTRDYLLLLIHAGSDENDESQDNGEVAAFGMLSVEAGSKPPELLPRDPTAAIELTFVIVAEAHRGKGIGKVLMHHLEERVVAHGFCFARLSTQDQQEFYRKCGYRVGRMSQRIDERRCFQTSTLGQQGLDHLNSFLLRRRAQPIGVPNRSTSMFKQLLEEAPGEYRDPEYSGLHAVLAWLRLGWKRQVGPSCGLSLLRMIRHAALANDSVSIGIPIDSLLQLAVDLGATCDGEVLSCESLAQVARAWLPPALLVDACVAPFSALQTLITSSTNLYTGGGTTTVVFLVPYDRNPAVEGTCEAVACEEGRRAHWGVMVCSWISEETSQAMVALQHGASPQLCVASLDALKQSNAQLRYVLMAKQGPLHAGDCLTPSADEVREVSVEGLRGQVVRLTVRADLCTQRVSI